MTDRIDSSFPMHISIVVTSAAQLSAVYALLGGVSAGLLQAVDQAQRLAAGNAKQLAPVKQDTDKSSDNTGGSEESGASAGTGETATTNASPSDGETDAHGHPWSAELHASTKGKTKDGLWRMKVGVSRPDPMPGFPTGTSPETPMPSATAAATGTADAPVEEDDEFAAFREAAKTSNAVDTAAAASVSARTFTDADLGALCNQAAVKLGDPTPVKELIAQYTPEGEVAHSRNIPADKREEFAKAVEAKVGIEFAG